MSDEEEHARIVRQHLMRGWDRGDAIEEADRVMAYRIEVRSRLDRAALQTVDVTCLGSDFRQSIKG